MAKKPKIRGAALVCANHVGFFDPIIILTIFKTRRPHVLATDDLYKTKVLAKFFDLMHCIRTDKENFSLSSLHEVIERLNDGTIIGIFPEGQINTTEKNGVLPFKSGISLMAYKGNAPILPMYIVKKKKWYERQRIVMGELIDIHEIVGERPSLTQINQVSEFLHEKELELRDYYEANFDKDKSKNKEKELENITQ